MFDTGFTLQSHSSWLVVIIINKLPTLLCTCPHRFLISTLWKNKWQRRSSHYFEKDSFSLHSEFLLSKYNNLSEPVVISLPLQILGRCGKVLASINHSLLFCNPDMEELNARQSTASYPRTIFVFFCSVTVIENPGASFWLSKCQSLGGLWRHSLPHGHNRHFMTASLPW